MLNRHGSPSRAGIYVLRHLPSGQRYVGSASNLSMRRASHVYSLRRGTHYHPGIQSLWNRDGPASFEFDVLFTCLPADLKASEQAAFDGPNPPELNRTYDARASLRGRKHDLAAKQRMSRSGHERGPRSEAHRKALSDAAKRRHQGLPAIGREGARIKAAERKTKARATRPATHRLKVLAERIEGTSLKTGAVMLFESIADAAAAGFARPNISHCLAGQRKSAGGYTWRRVAVHQATNCSVAAVSPST